MPEKQRDNYFILLGIDPKAPWSDEKFEKILIQKRADWTTKSKSPGRKGAQYREYLALVSEIQKIMRDPGQRAKEAEMAKTSQQETPGKVEQEKLIEKIDLISSKGFIEEREIQWLVREYQKFVPESFIRTEINRRNIQINQITQDVDESNLENLEILDEIQLKRIKGHSRPLNDDLSRAIANYSREIEYIKQKQITLQKQLQNAINDSCYYGARSLVKQIQIEVSDINTGKEEKLIEAKIKETEIELRRARDLERQGKNPIDAYKKVLWICKDFKQAKDALDKISPFAPSGLRPRPNKTRRQILILGGLAGGGFAAGVLTRDLWEQLFTKSPIQTFTTVRVDSRGDIISRSQGKAEVMTENKGGNYVYK